MNLNSIVGITISLSAPGVTAAGFGVPLIMSYTAAWVERVRAYASIDDVALDFASTTVEYKEAAKFFSQSPRPPRLLIGRCNNKPTQKWTITINVVADATLYEIGDGASVASFLSGAGTTNDLIITGLQAAVAALTDTITATITGAGGSHVLVLTGNAAGTWDRIEALRSDLLSIVQDNAAVDVASDLNAIKLANPDFYEIANPYASQLMVKAIADWVEADGARLYGYETQDTICKSVAESGGATDIGHVMKAAALRRSFGLYHPNNGDFAAHAWAGRVLPLNPGSETWAHKPLANVATVPLNTTEITNLRAKNLNFYTDAGGVSRTFDGKVASGEWIDVVRFIDWLEARIRERVVNALYALPKVPFDDDGIGVVQAAILSVLADGVAVGGLVKGSVYCTVPKAASLTSQQRNTRQLINVEFGGTLAGAIQSADLKGSIVP